MWRRSLLGSTSAPRTQATHCRIHSNVHQPHQQAPTQRAHVPTQIAHVPTKATVRSMVQGVRDLGGGRVRLAGCHAAQHGLGARLQWQCPDVREHDASACRHSPLLAPSKGSATCEYMFMCKEPSTPGLRASLPDPAHERLNCSVWRMTQS